MPAEDAFLVVLKGEDVGLVPVFLLVFELVDVEVVEASLLSPGALEGNLEVLAVHRRVALELSLVVIAVMLIRQ